MDDSFSPYYLRTSNKQEVDLILKEGVEKPPVIVEFKYSRSPKLEKGFYTIKEMLKPQMCYVVYPGQESYPISKDIEILSIKDINKIWNQSSQPQPSGRIQYGFFAVPYNSSRMISAIML